MGLFRIFGNNFEFKKKKLTERRGKIE